MGRPRNHSERQELWKLRLHRAFEHTTSGIALLLLVLLPLLLAVDPDEASPDEAEDEAEEPWPFAVVAALRR